MKKLLYSITILLAITLALDYFGFQTSKPAKLFVVIAMIAVTSVFIFKMKSKKQDKSFTE